MAAPVQGRLDPLRSGYSQPLDSPLYVAPKGGWAYRDCDFAVVTYETDLEPVLDVLPAPLKPAHDPPRATVGVIESRDTAFGDFNEMKLEIACEYEGEEYRYCAYIVVSALDDLLAPDAAMAVGREVLGVPKKIGRIRVRRDAGQVRVALERPIGTPLCDFGVVMAEQVAPEEVGLDRERPGAHLRVIPSVEGGAPSVAELVRWDVPKTVDPHHVWRGPGYVWFGAPSPEDPWFRFPARQVLGALAGRFSFDIPVTGKVLVDYNEPGPAGR